MILTALTAAWTWLKSLPEVAWWIVLAVALVIGFAIWDHFDDRAAVKRSQADAIIRAAPASEKAADERIADAFANQRARDEREAAIAKAEATEAAKPVEQRAGLPPTTVALNCARLRAAYTTGELAKMAGYRERCL